MRLMAIGFPQRTGSPLREKEENVRQRQAEPVSASAIRAVHRVANRGLQIPQGSSDRSQPLHWQVGRQRTGQFQVGSDEMSLRIDGQGSIKAVVNSAIECRGNREGVIVECFRRHRRQLSSLHRRRRDRGLRRNSHRATYRSSPLAQAHDLLARPKNPPLPGSGLLSLNVFLSLSAIRVTGSGCSQISGAAGGSTPRGLCLLFSKCSEMGETDQLMALLIPQAESE